jgi:hypothetical protein
MFVIKPWLFSIGTIVVPTLVRLEQPINYASLTSLINRFILFVQIYLMILLSNTFQRHFFDMK